MTTTSDIPLLTVADLDQAYRGSWYFIAGCGEPLSEWTEGYEKFLQEFGVGKPASWHRVLGETINRYAESTGYIILDQDYFKPDLTCLMFPLDGLNPGRLSIFKIRANDRWFDDVIQNMRGHN